MHSEPRPTSLANISRVLVCLFVFTIIAVGYFSSASKVETAETVTPPTRAERAIAPRAPIAPSGAVPFDFDGDGKTDIGRWHGASTEFKVWKSGSSSYQTTTIGSSTSKPVSGEFDDDGKYDVGTFLNGTWTVKLSKDSSTITSSPGTTGDIPVMGDFDGSGTSDCSVFRPSDNTWRIDPDCTGSTPSPISYGTSGDIPVPGDFDGDGTTDRAVYRPTTGYWYANRSSAGSLTVQWGISTDVPMAADFDNDGKDDLVVFRPSSGTWYVLNSQYGFTTYTTQVWGNWYDQPVVGYYDADGIADYAIWRPTTGEWWILKSTGGNLTYSLGVPGDTAIPSAFTKQVGGSATGYELATDRLDPANGTGGTDYYSRNFSWGTSLVSLPGRSGLDAGLGLSYNSLVWIKTGGSMYFDPDSSNVAPGFRIGMPTIEPIYYNDTRSKWAYMMVTPSGKRVEFLETTVDEVFETTDSSYTQLVTGATSAPNVPSEGVTMTVKTTDGTQMSYVWNTGAYRCTRIKDRNGNYIDITYSAYGKIEEITDTLGREINVIYDEYGRVWKIQQTWKTNNGADSNTTHTYATLTYTTKTVSTNWGVSFYGPPNDTAVTVLDKITYADGSATKFEYNGYIQVKKVTNVAADTTTNLNYIETDLADVSGSQSDVPRFGETRNWAKDFNGNTAVIVKNTVTASQSYTLGSATGTATRIQVWSDDHPDDLRSNTFVYASGWNEGLPIGTEDCITTSATCTTQKRWTWNDWTQDNESVAYILNPRIEESQVGDGTNTKKTTVSYYHHTGSGIRLPETVTVADATTVKKTQTTTYSWDSNHLSRRLIGLPTETLLYEGTSTLMSKVTYGYDEGGYTGGDQSLTGTTNHCTSTSGDCPTAYGTSFDYRGNLTSTTRWDINTPTTSGNAVSSSTKFNIAGSPISSTDPRGRTTSISYNDSSGVWNDDTGRSTFAYPKSITDVSGAIVTIKYRFDIGANVEASSPAPTGQDHGKTSKRKYDSVGRLERSSVYVNTTELFYTRFEFPTNGTQTKSYTTVSDVDGDGNIAEDEVYSESWLDGAGRVLRSRTEHPGSTGGWTATKTTYDILGRVYSQSIPTETDSNYDPAGDDYTRGWVYNYTYYDWMGRTTRTVPSDSNGSDGKDTLISYAGCGCAGGLETTIEGPSVARDDTSGNARRKQKVYQDILGRGFKTEVYQWDGSTVYTTTVNTFNGRDQITNTRQYAGSTASGTYQDVTMTYDGHGRMATRHYPIEDTSTYTTWAYNADDSVATITDPRGAVTAYTYETEESVLKRPLVTKIEYTPHSGGVDAPTVDYSYDNLGNRTSMITAGVSEVTYAYDSLSRMLSETVNFDDEAVGGNKTITYTYDLTGLKSIQDPFGFDVNYTNDKNGRLTAVTADPFGNNTTGKYADNIKYRAFGQVKEMKYNLPAGDATLKIEYDSGLKISHFEASHVNSSTSFLLKSDYSYMSDGSLAAKDDLLDNTWDRTNKYDFAGRMSFNQFGYSGSVRPYEQTVAYNAFSDYTGRGAFYWGSSVGNGKTVVNGRITTSPAPTYDAAGNITYQYSGPRQEQTTTYDASGRATSVKDKWPLLGANAWQEDETVHVFDGDGKPVISKARMRTSADQTWPSLTTVSYQVWSSVLGKSLTTVEPNGDLIGTKVFAGGAHIATGDVWKTADPVTGTTAFYAGDGTFAQKETESEPLGGQSIELIQPPGYNSNYGEVLGVAKDPEFQCHMTFEDGTSFRLMPKVCSEVMSKGMENKFTTLSKKEKSPANVPQHSFLTMPNGYGRSDDRLAYSAKSTKKPKDEEGKAKCIPGYPCLPEEDVKVPIEPPPPVDVTDTGGVDAEIAFDESHACQIMANWLGTLVQYRITELGGAGAVTTHEQLDDIMGYVDANFTPFYTGWNGTISTATGDVRPSTGGIERRAPLGGPLGFKEMYIDSKTETEGQTHHFAAYFSAGINGFSGYSKAIAHMVWTDYNNEGDRNLGIAALSFGSSLRNATGPGIANNPNNPKLGRAITVKDAVSDRLKRFQNLGSRVKSTICN